MSNSSNCDRQVLICQNRTCRQQGASKVLAAFQAQSVAEVEVVSSGCLGQCGMGPMVVVLPDEVWYCGVRVDEVAAIAQRHLREGKPVTAMLYKKFHHERIDSS